MDGCVVDCLMYGLIEILASNTAADTKEVVHGVCYGACDDTYVFRYVWHHVVLI